jgi:glutathione peroxidase
VSNIPYNTAIKLSTGGETTLEPFRHKLLLIVNVASHCGFTPQYTDLQKLQDEYGHRGLQILGFPCNQFGAQEAGTNKQIAEFCTINYGVTFPIFAKIRVNGGRRHAIYKSLVTVQDALGKAGKVRWNFEKFLVAPGGEIAARFRSKITPDDPAIVTLIERLLPLSVNPHVGEAVAQSV